MPSKPRNGPLLEHISLNPLMIAPNSEGLFVSSVEHVTANDNVMAAFNATTTMSSDDDDYWPTDPDDWMHSYRPYVVKDGVLQIPVMGVLLNHFPWQLGRWATGYKYIEMALKRGMEDGNVLAIAFVIDSPGGEVAGCFELCAKIITASGEKTIRAFAADSAYSAAYAIAASCGTIIVTQSGGVGSVGVVTAHIEYSDYLQKQGIKVTFIFAGDHKVDGNSYEKLPKNVKDRIQKRIDKIYGVFCGHVSEGRNMEDADVRATNALTYDAEEAIEVGFADRIGSLEEEMVIFTEEVAESAGENYMAQPNVTGQKPGATTEAGIDQATYDRGVADAKAEGVAEGSASMLTRIKAIVQSDEGKDRPTMATTFALDTSMSAAEAVAVMKNLPKEEAKTEAPAKVEGKTDEGKNGAKVEGKNHFAEHMDATGGAGVNGVEDDGGEGDDTAKATNSILSAFGAVTGLSRKSKAA